MRYLIGQKNDTENSTATSNTRGSCERQRNDVEMIKDLKKN